MKITLTNNLIVFLAFLLAGGLGIAQNNIFLDRAYWKANPSIEEVKNEIAAGNDPTELNRFAFDAISWALIEKADNNVIKYLLTFDGNGVNKLTHDGRTYIFWAAYKDNLDIMQYLIDKGAKTNIIDSHGYSLLNFAATTGQVNTELYDFILEHGGNPVLEKNREGANALLLVAPFLKDEKLVHYFTEKGVAIDSRDDHGNGLFQYAAKGGYIPMLKRLIAKGLPYKSQDKNGGNAILMAAQGTRGNKNTLEIYQFLESQGISVNVVGTSGRNPLHFIANDSEDTMLYDFFLDRGVEADLQDTEGNTPFSNAARNNSLAIVQHLVTRVKNLDLQDKNGSTALMKAIQRNSPEVVSLLIEQGSATNLLDKEGNSVAYYWVKSYQGKKEEVFQEKFQLLAKQGVDFTKAQGSNNTLLHIAAKDNNLALLKRLVSLGIDINAKNKDGYTALHIAAMKADQDGILKFLLLQGADAEIKTDFEESVYDLASENELLINNKVSLNFLNE